MKKLKKILQYAAPYKRFVFLNIVFNIFAVVFELLSLLLFIPFLSLIFGTMQPVLEKPQFAFTKEYLENLFTYYLSQQIDGTDKTGALVLVCILVAALFFLKNLFRYLALYFISGLRNGVVRDIRQKVYAKILSLPLSFFSNERKGDIIARLTNDVQEIEWSILTGIEMVFREPIAILLSLTVMIMISPSLTLFAFILLPVSGFIIGKIGKSLRRTSTKGQNKMGELLSFIEETIGGLRIIKAFTAEDYIFKKFKDLNNEYKRLLLKMSRKRDLASPVSEFLGALVMVALVWYGGKLIL
ncbi:MAG TPA: antibiotic ABC transporter ATP-binding protein, partial [Flavobacteriales bacterium]|nr:antibiotic ABC transporter ATP-binding protein [Flavobacteriales bacterium]